MIDIQSWLYQKLSAEVSTPVYDVVPDNAELPYIVIDNCHSVVNDFICGKRHETNFIYLSIWSNYEGQKEVKQIISEVDNCLRGATDSAFIGSLIMIRKEVNRDADGVTYVGSVGFKVITVWS